MKRFGRFFIGKTNRLAWAGIVGAALAVWTGQVEVAQGVQAAVVGLLAIFLRDGVRKSGPEAKEE